MKRAMIGVVVQVLSAHNHSKQVVLTFGRAIEEESQVKKAVSKEEKDNSDKKIWVWEATSACLCFKITTVYVMTSPCLFLSTPDSTLAIQTR